MTAGIRLLLSLCITSGPGLAGSTFQFDTAKVLYEAERFEDALRHLKKSDQLGEDAPMRQLYRGMALAQLQRWVDAKHVLLDFVAGDAFNPDGWYWLSASQYYTKEYERALASIDKAIALRARDGDAFRMRGLIRFQQNDWNGGYRDWIEAARLNPRDARTLYYLGRLFQEAGQLEQAKLWLTDAVRIQPGHFEALTYLGLCEESSGALGRAEELFRKAVYASERAGHPFSWAYTSLGDLLRKTERAAEARLVLEKGLKLTPEPHLLHSLAKLLVSSNEKDRAEQLLWKAIAKDPHFAEARYQLGRLLAASGRMDESREQMKLFQQAKETEKARPQIKVLVR